MAAPPIPNEVIIDDDDEFDWEAAVREIDVACQGTEASTSRSGDSAHGFLHQNLVEKKLKNPATSRQSTLDKFVRKVDGGSVFENESHSHSAQDNIGGVETGFCTEINHEAAKTWIYPVNVPRRDYQFSITKTALFSNTLVALPTGLGKTLIAAVVMFNYFRWFPEGKIVFAAPSRPLVMQQIEACHNIVGMSQEWTIDMTGQTSPSRRACFWKIKRVFFVTPQVLEKDIQSGICLVKHLVCLVIDEAHRATGNYSYCVALRELMAVPVQLRILALTATPGAKQQTIQNVIDNLHISKLEYRNESDPDVSPFVHNRKLELIQVEMGKDAIGVNNLLLEAIQPFVYRLCSIGVLQNRDFQTLSPCDLLTSRDKFRQAPPLDLPHMKYGEVEGYFGVLITLYHIRKLLSSHGIRPAYEMLEEKLQQGCVARLLGKNEVMWRAKLLMQQSLSHGAPNPKLSKMMEILIDHFKTKDPKNSRVIIFSNFRGSVRDIMDSLSNIGELVKATQFIGQSSGKALKGQTQKVQQAVLEKFRSGGFNVIVATSIGEEGLDIMEVDLVICFDANISPLRMIQRMGRTGRKHDGRVVVLACEGSELKGYLRKQVSSKAVRKHMRNGGINSFDFHSSPRMVPHFIKPEVQFVELSIEQFVPRGKKVKDDPIYRPTFTNKLSDAETELIGNYFPLSRESTWKPSLIVFPHFQAFPSRVHNVMHSFRTGILIDTMHCLQGLSFSRDSKIFLVEGKASSGQCLEAETVAQNDNSRKDLLSFHDPLKANSQRKMSDFEASPTGISRITEKHCMPVFPSQNASVHCFLFGADFVSVDAVGKVLVASVPLLPFMKNALLCKSTGASTELPNCMKEGSFRFSTSPGDCNDLCMPDKSVADLTNSPQKICIKHESVFNSRLCNSDAYQEQKTNAVETIFLQTPILKQKFSNLKDSASGTPDGTSQKTPISLDDEGSNDFRDNDLSPRLTNMIKEGVVPESPIGDTGHDLSPKDHIVCVCLSSKREDCGLRSNCHTCVLHGKISAEKTLDSAALSHIEGRNTSLLNHVSPAKLCIGLSSKGSSSEKNEKVSTNNSASGRGDISASCVDEEIHTPLVKMNNSANTSECIPGSPIIKDFHTPLVNLTNHSCSRDWYLSSGETSKTVHRAHNFKRLRKYGDSGKRMYSESMKENFNIPVANLTRSFTSKRSSPMTNRRGKRKPVMDVKSFIEEEAEVSSDAEVSDDEDDDKDNNSYDDSFIDDRLNPTAASTQLEAGRSDMMAIYRRSLLSQSPVESQPNCYTEISPDSLPPRTKSAETGSCSSGRISSSLQTPGTDVRFANQSAGRNSDICQMDSGTISLVAMPGETSGTSRKNESKMDSRKRKLFYKVGYVPAISLDQEWLSEDTGKASMQGQAENGDVFYDDQFYAGLDLDAMEAQATKLLRYKSESTEEKGTIPNPTAAENLGLPNSPSFDLGI